MWQDLDLGFKTAFEAAWDGYKTGSKPIGAAIVNSENMVVAAGRSQENDKGPGLLSTHRLAHAGVNVILQISGAGPAENRSGVLDYTLYTTMEPCPFCFGAIVMGNIRHVKFGARNRLAGATILNKAMGYIEDKGIGIEGPYFEPEMVQMALMVCHEIENNPSFQALGRVLGHWTRDCATGVEIGKLLASEAILKAALEENEPMHAIFDDIILIADTI